MDRPLGAPRKDGALDNDGMEIRGFPQGFADRDGCREDVGKGYRPVVPGRGANADERDISIAYGSREIRGRGEVLTILTDQVIERGFVDR